MVWRCPACAVQNNSDVIYICKFCGTHAKVTGDDKIIIDSTSQDTTVALCKECYYVESCSEDGFYTCSLDNKSAKEKLKRILCDKSARVDSSFHIYKFLYASNLSTRVLRILCSSPTQYNTVIQDLVDCFRFHRLEYNFSSLTYPLVDADSWLSEENIWGAAVLTVNENSIITLTGEFDLPYTVDGILFNEIEDNNYLLKVVKCLASMVKRQLRI